MKMTTLLTAIVFIAAGCVIRDSNADIAIDANSQTAKTYSTEQLHEMVDNLDFPDELPGKATEKKYTDHNACIADGRAIVDRYPGAPTVFLFGDRTDVGIWAPKIWLNTDTVVISCSRNLKKMTIIVRPYK